ncbi:MAG: fasciclin domain-containing protein [Prevotella sp.]|nr:fasciclin domain-containing protein [Prevotella sp.]
MKKFLFCISLVLTGLMTSCVDKYEEVDADSKPSWLGGSIYSELKNPNQERLTGTFTNYLRLIDDLGYDEVLNRTGSKTVFPANDEAFERFFKSNDWGVSSYEQLSLAQKKLLLYSSMLDNALLLGLLPNVSNGTNTPDKGEAVKHATNVSVIDTIQHIADAAGMPQGNRYWEKYYDRGIDLVTDATIPMMVHLTREYMLHNNITTLGDESDFAVLTGTPFTEGTAYIFNNQVINGDVTCQNGYIHQLDNVLVPPGNMAQVLRRHSKMTYFSRILDHYAAPYYDATTTRQYNDWAKANNLPQKDSIFQMRYMSTNSQDVQLTRDPNGTEVSSTFILSYDPGWNQYSPMPGTSAIKDIGAFFVPDDNAVKDYFLPGGGGSHLIDIYGGLPNTEANLMVNLDSLHSKKPGILASFTKNLMKTNFSTTVPSKFDNVTNDASENMGLKLSLIDRKDDGKYDITIANNGVVYLINEMIVPDEYRSVMAPASEYPDMKIMNWLIQDPYIRNTMNPSYTVKYADFYYYLKAMSANYAFFIPEDKAFDFYYVDPATLGHVASDGITPRPDVLHIYYDSLATREPYVKATRYYYDPTTGGIDLASARNVSSPVEINSQLEDILNYHTLVLDSGAVIGQNHYYKTKHGGEVYVDGSSEGGRVISGSQIENPDLLPAPRIKNIYGEKNGHAYRIDRLIQPPHKSVYAVLDENKDVFSEFLDVCTGFQATELLAWAGISDDEKVDANGRKLGFSEQDAYIVFTRNYKLGATSIANACLDYNVKMFNTYNYTLFAPDNTAMAKAYADGLPKWTDIVALGEPYLEMEEHEVTPQEQADKDAAKKMITQIRDFVRYHFVTNSVYADNTIEGGDYQSLSSDERGIAKEIGISGGNGQLILSDRAGHTVTVNADDNNRVVNKMARDYWLNAAKTTATAIETSSFCAVHQISEPLYGNKSGKFNE